MTKEKNPVFLGEINNEHVRGFLTGETDEVYWKPYIVLYSPYSSPSRERKILSASFLRQIVAFPNEVGIFKTKYDEWCGFSGRRKNLVVNMVDPSIKVFVHSHVVPSNTQELPSPFDLINYFDEAKNCIISPKGLTIFTIPLSFKKPIQDSPEKSHLVRKKAVRVARSSILLQELEKIGGKIDRDEYLKVFKKIGISWELLSWEELTESKLQEVFGE